MTAKSQPVRCRPPVSQVLVCRACDASFENMCSDETFDDQACTECGLGIDDPQERPAGVLVDSTALPIEAGRDGPHGCCSCGNFWVVTTHHVVWHFEGGFEGSVCPDCARKDPETAVWQKFCDIADSIDGLMQMVESPDRRKFLADLVAHRASWFSLWRDPPADPED